MQKVHLVDGIVFFLSGGLEKSSILGIHGNLSYIQTLLGYLNPHLRSQSYSRYAVCWNTSKDGWDGLNSFHAKCDGRGPTVTIVRVGPYVFGGYADVSWQGIDSVR